MDRLGFTYEFLWGCALGMVPLAVCAWFVCGLLRERPAARHAMWMVALVSLVTPVILVALGVPRLPDFAQRGEGASGASVQPAALERGSDEFVGGQELATASGLALRTLERDGWVSGPAWTRAPESPVLLHPSELTGVGLPSEIAAGPIGAELAGASGGEIVQSAAQRRSWRDTLISARGALLSLPAIPRWLWAGGAVVFGFALLLQLNRLRRIVRHAGLATWDVQQEVRALSERMGLKRAPEALFVSERISPMITCGFTPRVLLPRELWDELDQTSRQAVLIHELAHLRRRDHVLVWVETMLGVLYWWHPVVWWVRRNLHEDADLCCDAWVTSLLPRHRRAYAEALVTTREFIGNGGARPVSCTLGMTSARAKRFSRRLSMVMTRKMSPRASGAGLALAVAALAGGAVLSPTLACPPEEQEKAALAYLADVKPASVLYMDEPVEPTFASSVIYSGLGVAQPERRRAANDLEARLSRLEAQLDRLVGALESRRSTGVGGGSVDIAPAPRFRGNPPPAPMRPDEMGGDEIQRGYALPEGKFKDLWELMARPDVPVFVSQGEGNTIVLHGTAAEHRAFKAFVGIINPKAASSGGGGGVRSDAGEADVARRLLDRALRQGRDAPAADQRIRQSDVPGARSGGGRAAPRGIYEGFRLEQQAERMQGRAEDLAERSELLLKKAEELDDAGQGKDAERLEQQAEALMEQVEMLNAEAEILLAHAEESEADDEDECDDEDDDDGMISQ